MGGWGTCGGGRVDGEQQGSGIAAAPEALFVEPPVVDEAAAQKLRRQPLQKEGERPEEAVAHLACGGGARAGAGGGPSGVRGWSLLFGGARCAALRAIVRGRDASPRA